MRQRIKALLVKLWSLAVLAWSFFAVKVVVVALLTGFTISFGCYIVSSFVMWDFSIQNAGLFRLLFIGPMAFVLVVAGLASLESK